MNRVYCSIAIATICLGFSLHDVCAQSISNPILFVTQVPTPQDSATVAALFGNHGGNMMDAPRGGDLWIRYADGSTKNLTQVAGWGTNGQQGASAIAVREPSVHWSGTKALFSMVVGGALQQGDTNHWYWQIYEISGLGKSESPIITKVTNQPLYNNNVSPIYGTDERIIFTSDRTRTGEMHLYPSLDEYKGTHTNTGLWSLDPKTGDIFQLDNSPSGDFSPTIDSYGRLLFMRWDRLQRDRNADLDALGTGVKGTCNFTDESPAATPQYNVRTETFPEPQGSRTDLLSGTNMLGFEFNQFFPWMINEDGTTPETINHLGRHEMRQAVGRSINDDPNVVQLNYATSGRKNQSPLVNLMQMKEDPTTPGTYYGIDAFQTGTHSGGQIVSLTAAPTLDPDESVVTYITNRATQGATPEGGTPNVNHSGFYRNPIMMSGGILIAVHSPDTHAEKNLGTRSNPVSRFAYRLQTMKQSGSNWIADQFLTTGISKTVTYWDVDTLVHFNGTLWELDPVEVRVRTKPTRRVSTLPQIESQVFASESVDVDGFTHYMNDSNVALVVSRDITHRDGLDHQQPFFLRIAGTNKQSANPTGKVYDVSHMQFYQGDYIRALGMTSPTATPHEGRRILAVPMHLDHKVNPESTGPAGSVNLGADGSMASFVPARHATTWQLVSPSGAPVVRERYWVTFQRGEIRVCASCHGTNDAASVIKNPVPQSSPEALRDLLRDWRTKNIPSHVDLRSPANASTTLPTTGPLKWSSTAKSSWYVWQVSTDSTFQSLLYNNNAPDTATVYASLKPATKYYWRVSPANTYGKGDWSETWNFTTAGASGVAIDATNPNGELQLSANYPNPFSGVTTFDYVIAHRGLVTLSLYDAAGRLVRELQSTFIEPGSYSFTLDLHSAGLNDLASGAYVLRISDGSSSRERVVHVVR